MAVPSLSCTTPDIREGLAVRGRKVNVAAIDCGSKGAGDIAASKHENVVALCDVDFRFAAEDNDWGPNPLKKFPKAERYTETDPRRLPFTTRPSRYPTMFDKRPSRA